MRGPSAGGDLAQIASDPDAFEAFYRMHVDAVQRFVARRVDDPHLAADLIADIFLAAIDSAHTYSSDRGDPAQWLYGVARNVVAAERRRSARELRAASLISGRALVDSDDLADLVERIDAEARARQLYEAIGRLSDDDRDLLELVALDGLSVSDAATLLGLSPVAARVRLHRARQLLRARLAQPMTGLMDLSQRIVMKEASS
jgi:RNA polymerase sigma factor (sigma-70 family)